jgi:prepilin-type N-terminal cleavage/methylation domain-containing protein
MQPRIVGRLCQTLVCPRLAFHRMEPQGRERHGWTTRSGERAGANESNALQQRRSHRAFTLIELLVVIAIIAILIGLLFPAFKAVQNQAKQTQAKNDLTQIVNAVNAYYTEYGKYPIDTAVKGIGDATYSIDNYTLVDVLRNMTGTTPGNTLNPRGIVFISPPSAKDPANPRSGIASQTVTVNGILVTVGSFMDPWGTTSGRADSGFYHVAIDGSYDNQIANPYTAGAGPARVSQGVIAWSLGKDGAQGTTDFNPSDDVISWQ